jgi:CO/xanthine dehydrogenase Mo-binding subunit
VGLEEGCMAILAVEAAVISQKMKAPVKLIYTREDDLTNGVYRPSYYATYRAALDENKNLIAFHVTAGGIPESPLHANRFPAGAIDNYLAQEWSIPSNISVGAFRAPASNFIAGAEQSFLDEVAEAMGKDPIQFRLDLFEKAKSKPVGKDNDYDIDRYAGVLKLVREKSGWDNPAPGVSKGVSAYFCHRSYIAHVFDVVMKDNKPVIEKVTTAVDCGIVVNPDAATNLSEGAVTDAIGHSMYSAVTFTNGVPDQSNFDRYRLIRHSEAPKKIETHFVKSEVDPTGMGEPSGPPAIGALANALYKATGKRFYAQPFSIETRRSLVLQYQVDGMQGIRENYKRTYGALCVSKYIRFMYAILLVFFNDGVLCFVSRAARAGCLPALPGFAKETFG